MYCRNCGHENPKHVRLCVECGADFQMSTDKVDNQVPKVIKTTFASCLINLLSYSILLVLILSTIAFVAGFSCVIEIPKPPESGFPEKILNIWIDLEKKQDEKCTGTGYGDDLSRSTTKKDIQDLVDSKNENSEAICEDPKIIFEPENGLIGSTFIINLEDFSANDLIEACWYFPDQTLINCADLKANERGFIQTKFWSEPDDPTGVYSIKAIGKCSQAEKDFEVLPNPND